MPCCPAARLNNPLSRTSIILKHQFFAGGTVLLLASIASWNTKRLFAAIPPAFPGTADAAPLHGGQQQRR
jgi:hypothetical protein